MKKSALLNVLTNLMVQMLVAVSGFYLQPLIIQTFGSTINGMVASIGQFISYLVIVEAGVGAASTAALYAPLATNDRKRLNAIISSTRNFYNKAGSVFLFLVVILAFIYPQIVKGQVDRPTAFLMVIVLGLGSVTDFFFFGKYRVLLTADQKYYVLSLTQFIGTSLNLITSIFLIRCGFSILVVKTVSVLVYFSRYFVLLYYMKKKYPYLNLHEIPDNNAISQKWDVLIHQISGLIVFNSPIVLITIFCGLKEASVYGIYAMVFIALDSLLSSFSNGMQSFFGESLVKDDVKKTRVMYARYETLFLSVLGWTYSCAFVLIMSFMKIYTRNMTDVNYIRPELAALFVLVAIANKIRVPGQLIIDGAGHYKKTKYRSLIEAGINLSASIVFVNICGLSGVLIGSICSYIYRTIDIIIYSNTIILKKSPLMTFVKILALVCVFGLLSFAIVSINHVVYTYIQWLLYALVTGSVLSIPIIIIFVTNRKFSRSVVMKEIN